MTRKLFLGLLGLGAAGQRTVTTPIRPEDMASMYPGGSKRRKPRNGECPVCGTMAPAYFPQKGRVVLTYPPSTWPDEPPTRTVSCAHCRVRFDQDAEDVK